MDWVSCAGNINLPHGLPPTKTFSPDFEGPFRQLSKSSAREKNQVQQNLDLHFAINISGNSPFETPVLTKNAERYEW
jgi:hypothetical protein